MRRELRYGFSFGQYNRRIRLNLSLGAGNQFGSLSLPGDSGNPTYQDLTAWSDDKFRVADKPPRITGSANAYPVWSKISNASKRLGFRSHNFLAKRLSETSRACTIRVRRSTLGRLWNDLGSHAG
jgi:hypothetical protein